MRRMTYFVMVMALLLGFTQCKKEQIEPQSEGNGVRITLNVENGGASTGSATDGSKVDVDPYHSPMVTFENGDKILVGYDGKYVGTLTHNGSQFAGDIVATVNGTQKLYFYFIGNKQGVISVGDESCTVNISDQSAELPVLSFSASNEDFTGAGSYTATLHNQCALVKFTMENTIGSVTVGGMHTEATISFATPSITPTETTGEVHLFSRTSTEKWAILLPQEAVASASVATVCQTDLTVSVPKISANAFITSIPAIANDPSTAIDLAGLTGDYTASNGDILYGTLGGNYKISIAAGATVTLDEVTINGVNNSSCNWAGITCNGNADIVLFGNNTVKGFYDDNPGIRPGGTGTTLTISGTGSLTVSNNGHAAGIGCDYSTSTRCGNITITGGTITAIGSTTAAGIGSGSWNQCGDITITGGIVTAYGGDRGAGIGTGDGNEGYEYESEDWGPYGPPGPGEDPMPGYPMYTHIEEDDQPSVCGTITISGGIVVAIGGDQGAGIGTGQIGNCGTITIGGSAHVTAIKGSGAQHSIGRGVDTEYSDYFPTHGLVDFDVYIGGSSVGYISASPYTYP